MRGASLNPAILVRDASGERTLDASALPLRIGTGPSAAIRLPGPVTDTTYALIGVLDGRPFLQPTGANLPLAVGGVSVDSTRWLADGDEISAGSARIRCVFADGRLEFGVGFGAVDYDTLPPEPPAATSGVPPTARVSPKPKRARRPIVAPLVYAGLAVLAVLAYGLVTSRAVLIEPDPARASVDVAGVPDLRIGGRHLLRPGRHIVRAEAEGYAPAEQAIEVGAEASQTFRIRLRRLPGLIGITTVPDVAGDLAIDGKSAGRTPVSGLELETGIHRVTILAPRFLPWEAALDVSGGGVRQQLTATLVPSWAEVGVTTTPSGADVFVDGAPAGTTPATLELMPGARTLRVQKEGYRTLSRDLVVAPNQPQTLVLELKSAAGLVRVYSDPAGAAVTAGGRYRGTTPLETELEPGRRHELAFTLPGHEPLTRTIDLAANAGATVRVSMSPVLGIVRIRADPADAELLVDGKPAGIANRELSLPAVEHRIEVRKAGYRPFLTEVTPERGAPRVLDVKLLTEAQAAEAAVPKAIRTSQGMELRLVGGGQFRMGAPRREQGRRANETERDVRLTRSVYLSVHEVNNDRFREFRPAHTSGAERYTQLAGGSHPVVMVSWEDAAAFCNWLSDREGLPRAYVEAGGRLQLATPRTNGYRLPTEAEWAWAARYSGGAGKRRFPWGDALPPASGSGNYADRSAQGFVSSVLGGYDDGFALTAPVGSFAANPLGLFDLGGNVAEWVNDRYTVYPAGGPVATDPTGPDDGQYHVIRGSGWRHGGVAELRFAYRDFGDVGRLDVGFRIARDVQAEGN